MKFVCDEGLGWGGGGGGGDRFDLTSVAALGLRGERVKGFST